MSIDDFTRISLFTAAQALRHPLTQMAGFRFIVDFKDTGFRQIKYCTLSNVKLIYLSGMECLPVTFKSYHVINGNFATKFLWAVMKLVLPASLRNMFNFHSSTEELFDFFPRSIIPKEYGGELENYFHGGLAQTRQ
ncbi:clavesin-1 [Caerostris extrusa]|uniref:Clavesin-1 n=1 Tax=Caerostris extrusa TaxID=172846 RepID=A0AAV4R8A9_CAEEX|nr:clavesin-1 [Caerostris extrusa]